MPLTQVIFYQEKEGDVPALDWLKDLRHINVRAFLKCRSAIARLADLGHELRRPEADVLRDGIYELRVRCGSVNYRILYFFHGHVAAVLSNGLTKEDKIPATEIKRAVARKTTFTSDPQAHTFTGEIDDAQETNN
jgi:putative component of toxin-antitoxin plasmid stabilization module